MSRPFRLFVAFLAASATLAAAEPRSFSFSKLNHSYENLVGDLQPITQGPLTVEMSSPGHTVILKSNKLVLTPLSAEAGAPQQARLEPQLMGKGQLVADVEGAGLQTRLQDELFVPPQTVTLEGKIKLRRVPGGYEVTPLELAAKGGVKNQSKLSNDLLSLCGGVAIFTGLDCAGLERALSVASVPMPAPGGGSLLPDSALPGADRAGLGAWLGPAAGAGR